jgi:hypothetical protein
MALFFSLMMYLVNQGWPTCDPRGNYLRHSVAGNVATIHFNKHYMPTEHNIANLLAQITFRNCNSSLLRQQTINQSSFSIYTQMCDPRANHHELFGPPVA